MPVFMSLWSTRGRIQNCGLCARRERNGQVLPEFSRFLGEDTLRSDQPVSALQEVTLPSRVLGGALKSASTARRWFYHGLGHNTAERAV